MIKSRLLGAIARCRRGTAAIELGIVLPTLSIMALATIDVVIGFSHKVELQQYAQSGADFVIANGESLPSDTEVKEQVAALSGLPASQVSVAKWTECNQAKQSTFDSCPGASDVKASYMQIDVTNAYAPILNIPGIADFVGGSQLTGTAVVRIP